MIYVLQNMNQKVIAVTGANIFRSLYASTAFVLELFIHFFFRSESSLSFHELISSFLWAYLVYLKEFFLEITVKIGIDRLKSIKQTTGNTNDWPTHFFIYLIFCLKICWVLCTHSTFPRFSSSSIAQVFIKFKEIDLWKSFKFFGFIFIFWGLVFECEAILAYSC